MPPLQPTLQHGCSEHRNYLDALSSVFKIISFIQHQLNIIEIHWLSLILIHSYVVFDFKWFVCVFVCCQLFIYSIHVQGFMIIFCVRLGFVFRLKYVHVLFPVFLQWICIGFAQSYIDFHWCKWICIDLRRFLCFLIGFAWMLLDLGWFVSSSYGVC